MAWASAVTYTLTRADRPHHAVHKDLYIGKTAGKPNDKVDNNEFSKSIFFRALPGKHPKTGLVNNSAQGSHYFFKTISRPVEAFGSNRQ